MSELHSRFVDPSNARQAAQLFSDVMGTRSQQVAEVESHLRSVSSTSATALCGIQAAAGHGGDPAQLSIAMDDEVLDIASPSICPDGLPLDPIVREERADEIKADKSKRADKHECLNIKFDSFGAQLESGAAFIPAHANRPDEIWYNELARCIPCTREDLRIVSLRERALGWAKKYGLTVPRQQHRSGPITVDELGKLMNSERKRQLKEEEDSGSKTGKQCAEAMSNMRWAFRAVSETFAGSADARTSIDAMIKLAEAGQVNGEKKLREELQRGLELLDQIEANGGLPLDVADMIQFAMDRAGVKDADVVRALGFRREYIWGLRTGTKAPPLWAFEDHTKLERYLNLPKGEILVRARRKRRGIGAVPLDLFPPEFRGRKNWIRFEMLKHLTPEDLVEDDAERHANMRRIADTLEASQSQYNRVLKKQSAISYRWGEAEWEHFDARAEWDAFVNFRTADILPYGMRRSDRRPREKSFVIYQDYFSALFGTWTAEKNPVFTMDPHDASFAYLVFPRLFHIRLEVASGWSKQCGGAGLVPVADIQRLNEIRALLDPSTGWLTQSPHLAEKLKPITGKQGEVIVSQAQIDTAKANWRDACNDARAEYGEIRKSYRKHCKRRRDPHEQVLAILKLENPLSAFQMLCSGLQREPVEPRSYGHACLIRDQVLIGILTQCAFRRETLSRLDLNHLEFDDKQGEWFIRGPRHVFKNEIGPYFVSPNGEVRDYERRLMDRHGLYAAIQSYLGWAREVVLAGGETNALLVSAPRRKRKSRGLSRQIESGRFLGGSIRSLVYRLTARHVGYKPKTGQGIQGITRFPPHAFRHILATGVLKASTASNPWQEAADAIHDGEDVVRKNYARYVPRDREQQLMKTLEAAFGFNAA